MPILHTNDICEKYVPFRFCTCGIITVPMQRVTQGLQQTQDWDIEVATCSMLNKNGASEIVVCDIIWAF